MASIVCAGRICDFFSFRLCLIRSKVMNQISHFKVTHSIVGCWRNENSKWPDRAQNGVNRLCFICAGELYNFFDCAIPAPTPRVVKTPRISMFGGAYVDACMPNWPHWHRTPLPGIATTGLCPDKGGNPSYMWWKLKMVRLVRKWYQSFVLCLCWLAVWFF